MTPDSMYILTDAKGFTTCCAVSMDALHREAGRVPLLAPITVVHWELAQPLNRDGYYKPVIEWRKVAESWWNGGDALWY